MTAGGLATALFFAAPDRLAGEGFVASMRLLADGCIKASDGLEGEFFL